MRGFIEALITEAQFYTKQLGSNKLNTLYLGGGTPSMLSPKHLKLLFDGLRETFDFSDIQELTFEANPATFDLNKAILFKDLGVTRVSLGIQSFDNDVLKTLGREHNRQQAIESITILREAGIPQINVDLMFAIPGQSIASWTETLNTALAAKPDHISAYNLTYEEDTAFIDKLTAGDYVDDPDANAEYFTLAHRTLTAAGFEHYETSNYAKKGTRSQHNASYWNGAPYLGLGPSAVSTIDSKRWKNLPDTAQYIRQINHVGHAQTEIEELTDEQKHLETIALQLRTANGLALHYLTTSERARAQDVIHEGMAEITNDHLVLTERGSLLVDAIVEHIV